MVQVLASLQAIELEVLSSCGGRNGEHVGSIRIFKGKHQGEDVMKRKLYLADMFKPTDGGELKDTATLQNEGFSSDEQADTDEDEVAWMMDEGSRHEMHVREQAVTTWRTARWQEPADSPTPHVGRVDGESRHGVRQCY